MVFGDTGSEGRDVLDDICCSRVVFLVEKFSVDLNMLDKFVLMPSFRNTLNHSGHLFSHLAIVPLIIRKLHLHYSIVLGAIGIGVIPFFYYITNPIVLSIVICLRAFFLALFDVSTMIYIVKLARISSWIQGNAVYSEVLMMQSLITIFRSTAKITLIAWREYMKRTEIIRSEVTCGSSFSFSKLTRNARILRTLATGQNVIIIAVTIVISLSGIILIAMYLKPISSFGDLELTGEPRISNTCRIFKQLRNPKAVYLAILITSYAVMNGMIDELVLAYVTCSHSMEYGFFINSMKELSLMFGVLACVTLIDLTDFRWLHTIAICGQLSSYICLLFWEPTELRSVISYFMIYNVLCVSISIEVSVLQLLVIQTIGDDEVSAWCLYYVLDDLIKLLRLVSDPYLCTGAKLWIIICISLITIISIAAYWYKFENYVMAVTLYGPASLSIRTSKKTLIKESSFDLKILVEQPEGIRKVETLLQRKYTLRSKVLTAPPDDEYSESQSSHA